jgi:hypothetical protein
MKPPLSVEFEQVASLFHYFGYKVSTAKHGVWAFHNKTMRETTCIVTGFVHPSLQNLRNPFIAKLEFYGIVDGKSKRIDIARVKTWTGIFKAIRNHTRRELFAREVQLRQVA